MNLIAKMEHGMIEQFLYIFIKVKYSTQIHKYFLNSFNFSINFEKVCDGISDCVESSDENYCSDIILDDLYDYKHSKNGI